MVAYGGRLLDDGGRGRGASVHVRGNRVRGGGGRRSPIWAAQLWVLEVEGVGEEMAAVERERVRYEKRSSDQWFSV